MKQLQMDFTRLSVTKACVDDVDEIMSLLDSAAEWIQSKGVDQWRPGSFDRERLLSHIKDGEVYIATYEGSIAGTFRLQMHDKSTWGDRDSNEDNAYIHALAIKPDLHGQQLGLRLLKKAEMTAISLGKKKLRLDCMHGNSALERYYESVAGYRPEGTARLPEYSVSLFEKELQNEWG
jgi:GNAT superfamily N-acetyltransferase